ncbi:O-antigen ligase family protein [Lacinutrix chionoecetis]
MLFVVTLPVSYGLNSVSAIVLGVFFFLDYKENFKRKFKVLKNNKLFLLFLLIVIVQLIGLLYTNNMSRGLKTVQTFLPFIALPLTMLTEKKANYKQLLAFYKWYMFSVLFVLLCYQFYMHKTLMSFENKAFEVLDISPFYYSAFLFLAVLITYFNLKKAHFKFGINYFLLLFFGFCILLLSARICLLVLILFLLIEFFKEFKSVALIKKIALTVVLFFAIGLTAYQVPPLRKKIDISYKTLDFDFKTILTKNQITLTRNSLEYRVLINYCSFNIFKENIFGVGTGDNRDALLDKYNDIGFKAGIKANYNCHNQYLEEFTKTGILGGVIFLIFIFYIIKTSVKNKRHLFYIALFVSIVCITESYINRQHGIMFTAFFLSLFYAIEKGKEQDIIN